MRTIFFYIPMILLAAACGHEIGDECSFDYDCSPNMERTCDLGQPGGYCLIIGCDPDTCPEEALCVEFVTPCPEGTGDPVIDEEKCEQIAPNRSREYCLQHCGSSGDCRSDYECVSVSAIGGSVIDTNTSKSEVCVPEAPEPVAPLVNVNGGDFSVSTDTFGE